MVTYLLRMGFGACTSTLFMTRESALDILWDEDLKRHQDYDFVIRYDKKYTLGVKEKPSVVYDSYKPTNKEAKIDFPSCISFIEKNKSDIQIETYRRYITHMFHLAGHLKAEEIILSYYKDELANLAVEESEINMEKFKDYNFNCQVEIVN
ncbi:MAG: hypothetical protein LIO65_09320, partial [Odoribacter sp.]|nr:hypothetical protein [Odoribacter sp.]